MTTTITDGVKVSVETQYQPGHSSPESNHYMFAYKINIENLTNYTVQLLRRRWDIFDSCGAHREVEGEGVVGEQPVIEPGAAHEYISGCNFKSDMGSMKGEYQMVRTMDNSLFEVQIPEIYMIVPYRLN